MNLSCTSTQGHKEESSKCLDKEWKQTMYMHLYTLHLFAMCIYVFVNTYYVLQMSPAGETMHLSTSMKGLGLVLQGEKSSE